MTNDRKAKFSKKLSQYKYLIMFDLASKVSGVCVWDLEEKKPAFTSVIKVPDAEENKAAYLMAELRGFLVHFNDRLGSGWIGKTLIARELCPMQQGKFTTAKTLIALGKAHAVLDCFIAEQSVDYYDLEGVAPATTHAYFRKLKGLPAGEKVEKEDVRDYLVAEYGIDSKTTLDESDAIFLSKTFQDVFWDKELEGEIKEKKRHMKALKAPVAIRRVQDEIDRLKALKTDCDGD